MAKAFPEASVVGYESLIRKLTNDSKDRHVLAAAIQAEASCIVTFNLKDFKTQDLEPHRIVAIHPDDFILPFCQESVEDVLSMIREHRSYLRRPPKTALEYVDTLEKSGLVRVAAELRAYQDRM